MIDVYLDDDHQRYLMEGAPQGYLHATSVNEVKALLVKGVVRKLSLDHDLGACETCMNSRTTEQWLEASNYSQMPNCDHVGTGYTLVCWMEERDIWPKEMPTVHSRNPVGRQRMLQVIRKKYGLL